MPRDIALGNGSLLVNFDRELNMRDLFYPGVGLYNHIAGHRNKTGIWTRGKFSWVDDGCWINQIAYQEGTLISNAKAVNEGLRVTLEINDTVHFRKNVILKKVVIRNNSPDKREFRLFFTHDLTIDQAGIGDTAIFDPTRRCICHYKRDRYFLINGRAAEKGIYQYSIGTKRFGWAEGTWKDAEDGVLEQNPISHGSIDSAVSFRMEIEGHDEQVVYYWIAAGRDINEAWMLNDYVIEREPKKIFEEIQAFWEAWTRKKDVNFGNLSHDIMSMYHRSLLVIRTQIDNGGAILAANDSDVLLHYPDHYSYVWPRDGALVAYALDLAGYPELSARFFEFCSRIISEGGYFLHKYNPDGTLGSSWHPWWKDDKAQLPIQEDETALVLFALGEHYHSYKDVEFIEKLYRPLVKKAADFLVSYRDPVTKLPLPSFDLWEERRGVFTFTCAAVYGALKAAETFASLLSDNISAQNYKLAATEVLEGMEKFLYCKESGRFLRGIYPKDSGEWEKDYTLDSSMYGIFEFGAFSANDPKVLATMEAIRQGLRINTEIGGIARYTGDYYAKISDDIQNVPGNPWVICTLWMAEWYADKAQTFDELNKARDYLEWAVKNSLLSGVMPEQVHPYTGEDLSVSPLTWSHSTFVLAVLKYVEKYRKLKAGIH